MKTENPRPNPTVPEVIPMVYAYRDTEGNKSGGSLHIVLDDGNVEDDDIKWCIQRAMQRGDVAGVDLGETLLQMSRTQRRKLSSLFYSTNS